ncbi:MAG: ATP-dependent DNA helicase RecG [Gammaproteobacteria bacterium]
MTESTTQTTPLQNIPCTTLKGVGPKLSEQLEKLNIHSVQDILFHLPLRYEDRTRVMPIMRAPMGGRVVIEGVIDFVDIMIRKRRQLIVRLCDHSGGITLRFFHFSQYQKERLHVGDRLVCFGEMRMGYYGREMIHPEYRHVGESQTVKLSDSLTPVYPSTAGMQQRTWLQLTEQAIAFVKNDDVLEELLPKSVREDAAVSLKEALCYVHRPPPDADVVKLSEGTHEVQQRLIFEELVAHRLAMLRLRKSMQNHRAISLPLCDELAQAFLEALPFSPTAAQSRVCDEIKNDLVKPYPMLRLLQGDVGSGKTFVAAMAVLQAIGNRSQAAVMAPTELLAEQHFQTFQSWFEPLGFKTVLLVSGLKAKERKAALGAIENGGVDVIIGTHALFQKEVVFHSLGLVIIDEQHRFGVHQRLALREKGSFDDIFPHQLIMTATPIPRTLAMSFYADLDCSVIDELPPGRQPVKTIAIPNEKRRDVVARISEVCQQGRQVYWVCPLIEESEVLQCQAAEESAKVLQKVLPGLSVGLVHGRLKPQEKNTIMQRFKANEIDVLVATTVIEVGVDVPNASLMVIENAERLGLAQLHQLRGRVGRGSDKSFCVLLYQAPLSYFAKSRLSIMRETNDGFKVAERDLELRGPGEVLGTRQTGALMLKIADVMRDKALLPEVQKAADDIIANHSGRIAPLISRWVGEREQFGKV